MVSNASCRECCFPEAMAQRLQLQEKLSKPRYEILQPDAAQKSVRAAVSTNNTADAKGMLGLSQTTAPQLCVRTAQVLHRPELEMALHSETVLANRQKRADRCSNLALQHG